MDLATVLSVVQTIISAIETLDQLKTMFSFSEYKNELERLEKTIRIVQSVLVDADAKQCALNHQEMTYIEELKDAIYDANDVLDEFITLVKRRKAATIQTRNKLSNKVRSFVSKFSRLSIHDLSTKVKDVNRILDDIASNSSKFMFKVDNERKRFVKPESSSLVSEDEIIGRREDLEKVIEMLFAYDDDDHLPNNVLSLAIVGMGGLGKTAFAQLLYNDPRVTSAFELKMWTCIADQYQWNLTEVLGKIVKELPLSDNTHNNVSLQQMQLKVEKQLGGKKYFLVLDDVWTESYHRWQDLEKYLRAGASTGSRIVVTTRSKQTAQIIGAGVRVHELQGLPKEESWRLFKRTSFLPQQLEELHPEDELVELGKEIVKKCANVPLAIRVVASLLRGKPKVNWRAFRDKELANISEGDDTINNILRLSYHQLDFPLKSCFAYCAIFPREFVIGKAILISLWMAQGYISDESVGEEYCLMLSRSCFFQDLKTDEWGEIIQFKIHDLFHDIAEQVARGDICRLTFDNTPKMGNKVRHLSLSYGYCSQETFSKTHIRSYVKVRETWNQSISDKLLASTSLVNWMCLRSLDLRNSDAESLPKSIGELFHLRCLNLSQCDMLKLLPDSITKLVNLQTLDLSYCTRLQELPKDMSRLLDLTTLNVVHCRNLSHMPTGMGLLTHLHTLGLFVLTRERSKGKQCCDRLEGLRSMSNLKGCLKIRIGVHDIANCVREGQSDEGAYLINKERLKKIHIKFRGRRYDILNLIDDIPLKNIVCEQALLDEMQPHHDLEELKLEGYIGETMPRWLRRNDNLARIHLPNFVTLDITDCSLLRCLTSLGELPRLKNLKLEKLASVEYILDVKPEAAPGLDEGSSLFPCLEQLEISVLTKLKGWWPRSGSRAQNKRLTVSVEVPCFPQLKELYINGCPVLESIPMCSTLKFADIDNDLEVLMGGHIDKFRRYFQTLIPSDSKSRIISVSDSAESNNIDTVLTTAVHRWMSTSAAFEAESYDIDTESTTVIHRWLSPLHSWISDF